MKKVIFSLMAIAAAAFTSCNKDNGTEIETTGDNVVMVKLPDNVVLTRGVEAPVTTGSNTTISDLTVFLLNGSQVVNVTDFIAADITAKYKRIENVSPTVNGVLAVANIPAGDVAAVKALTNANDIKAYAFSVASQNTGTGIAAKTLISDIATTATAVDPNPDGHNYKEASLTLNSLTARFEIGNAVKGTGVDNIEIDGVFVNGYYTSFKKNVVKNHASTDAVWTITGQTTGASATPFTAAVFTNAYTESNYFTEGDATVDAVSKVYAYQVFAGANIPQIILCVRGQYTTEQTVGGGDKEFLGFVTFNKYVDGTPITSVVANTIYKLGNPVINADMITTEPNLQKFDLGINVTLTPWTEKNVTPGI